MVCMVMMRVAALAAQYAEEVAPRDAEVPGGTLSMMFVVSNCCS